MPRLSKEAQPVLGFADRRQRAGACKRRLHACGIVVALIACAEYYVGPHGTAPFPAASGAGTRAAAGRPLPPPTPLPSGTHAKLSKHGSCWYRAPPGMLCAENGRLVLFGAARNVDTTVTLCTGYPQNRITLRPDNTEAELSERVQLPDDRSPAFPGPYRKVQLSRESRVTFVTVTTLETNFFHVVRDSIANLVDMTKLMPPEDGTLPVNGRVVLLPKHPNLARVNSAAFHFAFAGLVTPPWRDNVALISTAAPTGQRVCFDKAYVGQPFEGHSVGGPGRIAGYIAAISQQLNASRVHSADAWPNSAGKLRLLLVDRGSGGWLGCEGGPNRRLGNQAELAAAAEEYGFHVQTVKLHKMPSVEAQLRLVHGADVLMGAHGMALTWCAFLRSGAVCLELGIWRDMRPDYRYLSKWAGVHRLFVPLLDVNAVTFPGAGFSPAEKLSLNYYRPASNLRWRQCQEIRPDVAVVREKLSRAKDLASDPHSGEAGLVLDQEARKPS